MTPVLSLLFAAFVLVAGLPVARAQEDASIAARAVEPVVLTGSQIPEWSRAAAMGEPRTWPAGTPTDTDPANPFGDNVRSAHHGDVTVPPDPRGEGVPPEEISAFRFDGTRFVEVPVQVDERFPYHLANANSDFSWYSAVDEEITYEFDEENWTKTQGTCFAEYASEQKGTEDPASGLDDDDEIVFMASDGGVRAPADQRGPVGTGSDRQEIAITDPLAPGSVSYVYLFRRSGGSRFDASHGYVSYVRDGNADEFIDRYSIARDDPETLGTSNSGYGPNLSGTVCRTADFDGYPDVPDGTPRSSSDRFPRDGVTVSTDTYQWRATGRWMVRGMHVTKPGEDASYGPDLIDRWKGRAFQQSPDSTISMVGFEDEQVNWEANSTLLGERVGPVRAIRETWGADSGTNTTKTEIFYRDHVAYLYHLRVHPIPPDGIYQAWDHNAGVATTYYNSLKPGGVAIDGVQDDLGNIDEVGGRPVFFDVPDPTFGVPVATANWHQVSGMDDSGSLVYVIESKSPTTAENPLAFPYYNDDKCFDDGTGDDPVPRPWPGEPSTDANVQAGYAAQAGKPYAQLTCDDKQGAWGAVGLHVAFVNDTDNAFQSKPVTESVSQEWQFAVPTEAPSSVGERYSAVVQRPLVAAAFNQDSEPMQPTAVEIEEPTSGQATDPVVLEATLSDPNGPVEGAKLEFDFQGDSFEGVTDGTGTATATAVVEGPAEETPSRVTFEGNETHEGSSDEETFTVEHEHVTVEFVAGKRKRNTANVSTRLYDSDSDDGIGGRTLRVFVDGRQVRTLETDEDGRAASTIPLGRKERPTIEVRFDGDDTFNGASASARHNPRKGARAEGSSD